MAANTTMAATPRALDAIGPSGTKYETYNENVTASQDTCAVRATRNIDQPQRKPAIRPYASRKKTYWPPVAGNAAPSSAQASAPKKDATPAKIHTERMAGVDERFRATRLGTRKIPPPMTMPTTIA